MARRGRGAELNALRQKKKDEQTGSTTKKSQSSVSSNKNGGGRTGGLTKQQVQQKVSRSAGYTSSGKAKQPAQTQKTNPYATTRNIVNRDTSNVPERASRTNNRINSSNTRGREQAPINRRQTFATAVEMREARENERLKRNPAPTAKKMLEEREKNKDSKFAETVKNTGSASKKGFLDSVSGHAQTALDAIEAVEGNKHVTEHRARLHGVTDEETISKMTEGAQGVSKLAREKRLKINEDQEKRQEEFDKKTKNSSGLQKAIYGAAESGTGMATDLAIGRLTGTGQAGTLASMFSRTYGTTRGQAEKEGATESEDRLYAGLQALKEVGTELMFPGVGLAKGFVGKGGIKAGEKLANALTKNMRGKAADVAYAGLRMLGGTTEENLEEVAGWGLDPFIKDIAYGRNVRARAKESLMSDLPEITSREQAEALTARLNSDSYVNELAAEFKANGLGDKEAKDLATKMRDFYAAYYSGDAAKADELGDDLAGDLTGVKKISKESFSTSELLETVASTTLLTATTGLPGTISTAQRGDQIKQGLKADGLKALAKEVMNSEDAEASERGKVAQAALESGKDITSTQAYDLEQGLYQQQEKDVKRQIALIDTASKQADENGYVAPYTIDEYGRITSMEKATSKAYNEAAESASETIDHVDTKESLTDVDKAYGARAIAGFKTGAFTVDDANTIVADETIKDAFKAETGIDLKQYEIKNRDGSINIPKTNAATKDALFAMATDNLVKMAETETANWKDVTKGETLRQVTARMGAKGGVAAHLVLNDVDERDTMQYRTMTAVSDYVYQSALNLGVSWEDAKDSITSQFSTIPEEKLRTLYDAGLADRQASTDKMLGVKTKIGETMSKSADRIDPNKGRLFVETEETPGSSATEVFRGIAESLGIDIYIVDDLPIKDKDGKDTGRQANGQYVKGDIYINVKSTFEENLGFIFMHEVTHHLKQYAPEQYKALENLVREEWFKANPEEMLDRIARKIKAYEDAGQTLTEEEALEEIIADSTHEFLMDKNFAEQVSKKDPSLSKAVLSAIKNLLRRLRQIFSSGNYANSKTQMDAIFGQLGIMDEAEKLWLDAYTEAAKNKAAVGLVEWQESVNGETSESEAEITYDSLISKPDMEITIVDDSVDISGMKRGDIEKEAAKTLRENAQRDSRGRTIVHVKDTNANIVVGKKAIGHSLDRNYEATALVAFNLENYLENAIKINEKNPFTDPKNPKKNRPKGEIYLSYGESETAKYPAYFVVDTLQDGKELVEFGNLYDLRGKKISEDSAQGGRTFKGATSDTISVADLLDIVNDIYSDVLPKTVADHYGHGRRDTKLGKSMKYSLSDADYMSAVERGDMETAQRMVDEAAKAAMPNTKLTGRWYHGTENEFTEFNFSQGGKNGHADGYGIYLTNDPEVANSYGTRMIEGYVNVERPASALTSATLTKAELHRLIERTVNAEAETLQDEGYDSIDAAKFDTWISNYTDTYNAGSIDKAIDEVIDAITNINGNDYDIVLEIMTGMGIRDYDEASKFYDILTEETGIDGFETKWGDESEMADPNTPTIALAFRSEQIKDASPVTYDDEGNVIPLSERFNTENPDIRYSITAETREIIEEKGIDITESGTAVRYSYSSWADTDKANLLEKLVSAGYDRAAAAKWIDDVNSISAIIYGDMARLDYEADSYQDALKPNSEYFYTLDLSTLCQKRRLYQGNYNAIMRHLVHKALHPEDTVRLREMMEEMGLETPCGICYEESRKKNEGKFAETWLNGETDSQWKTRENAYKKNLEKYQQKLEEYNALEDKGKKKAPNEPKKPERWMGYKNMEHDDPYIPTLADVTTTDGRAMLRKEHPEALDAYLEYQKGRGSANPKVSFTHTDYRRDILRMTKADVENVKHIGGLRLQSFSDFESIHTIDVMQAIMDMATLNLTAQAYTKVPAFADIFGGTGVKINLSLIQKMDENGNPVYDENGRLVFDSKEGIDPEEAFRIRGKYSKNVGTILVGVSDQQILDAWADDRVDMVIPFHRSGWSVKEFERLGLKGYEDYQDYQSEKIWDPKDKEWISFAAAKKKGLTFPDGTLEELYSIDYWDKNKSGKENAEKYLQLCAEQKRRPVFYNFLQDNGDGTWSLKDDGSTDGYWKSLIDYKMYDNEGNFAPQEEVQPVFDMEAAEKTLAEYEGGADTLPVNEELVEAYLKDFKKRHPRAKIDFDGDVRLSLAVDLDEQYMSAVNSGNMEEAQRLVDEASRMAGYTTKGYHGTPWGGFTEFSTDFLHAGRTFGDGIYLTSSDTVAKGFTYPNARDYSRIEAGEEPTPTVYGLYIGDLSDALEFDWENYTHNGRKVKGVGSKLAMIQMDIEANPDKDVIIRNIRDGSEEMSDIYVIKNSASLKSSDPVTYAEDGSVIPLSERFDPNNNDIRYSLPTQDSDGNILTDGQVDYFKNSQARDEQGRMIPMYHVTPLGGFTVFDPSYSFDRTSLSFSNSIGLALNYASDDGNPDDYRTAYETRLGDEELEDDNLGHYKVYLNMENPLILEGDYLDEMDIYEWPVYAKDNGYDGVIYRDFEEDGEDIYQVFSSNQVKDTRNENPTENPDIRYSIPPEDETMNYAQTNADTTDNLWYTDPVLHEGAIRYSMSKKDFINGTTDKWNPAWRTEGRVLKEESVEKDIRNVIMGAMRDSDTNAKYRQKVVKDTMLVARKAFDYMKSDEHAKAAALLYDHAHSIIEDLEFFGTQDESEFQRYKELREYLRTTKITVPEDKRSDIDYEAFRRKNFRKILLGNGGIAPDKVWDELHDMWPEAFTEDIKGDIPGIMLQIENALDIYQPYAEAYSSEQCEEFAGDIANSLWDIIYEGEEYKSLADKYDDKAKAMKQRHQEAMRKVKENYKEKLTKQALEAKRREYRKLDEQKARLTDKHEQELSKTKENYERKLKTQQRKSDFEIATLKQNREYNIKRLQAEKKRAVEEERRRSAYKVANNRREQRERHMHRTLYDRVLKEYKDLTHRLLNPSKDKTKNIPEQLRQPLAQMLYCFDLEKERSKKLEEMYMIPTRSQLNFRQLKDAMEQVVKEDPTAYEMSDIHKYLKDKMTDLADRVDGKSIDALDEADMQIVKDLLSGLNKAIKEGQQLEIDGENYQKQVQCDKVAEGAAEHQKIYGKAKTYGGVRRTLNNIVNMGELTPIYFFKGIPGMYDMYRQLRTGFDEYVRNENDIIDKIADILAPYYKTNRKGQRVQGSEIEDWRHAESAETFDLISGDQTITLTIAQRMALYCLAKRSQAQGHMYSENGGIVASEITAGSKITKVKESVKGKIVEQKPVVLTPADVDNIIASLTEDQMKIAEKLQDLMSKDMSVLGNRASMKLTGIEMYKEDNYFPIKVQGDSRPTDIDNIGIREKIRNPGFSNPLVENAQNPIIIDDIFTVVASHCNEMNQYASYAVPITSFMKVYNGSVLDENGKPVKVKTLIRQTYGDKAITYIENFIDDINGNSFKRQGGLDDALDKALGRAKKAAVFANLRVALQQPTAIVRAFAVINPKYFAGVKPSPKATQEMIEHCPIAQWKAWGYYDTHFGRDIEDVMMGKNIPNKMDYFMSEIYGALDNMTWGMIWQAVKNEVKATNKGIDENSQEFWDLCNERASYVFDTTQVVDSPFHRSNDMRSKNGLVKQLTSFQAEPTLSFNVLRQGLVDAIDAAKRGDNSKAEKLIIRTLTVWTIQALTVALAQSFVDALRRKGKKDGDDDEDEMLTWYQEIAKYFLRNFGTNFADDMNALNNIYYIKDIVPPILNAIKGEYVFGQQNLTFQWVDSLTDGIEHCRMKWEKGSAYNKTWYDCISDLLGGIGYFAGVPAKTMMRGAKNAWHWFNKITGANVFADDGSVVDSTVESIVSRFRGSGGSSGSESSGTKTDSTSKGESKANGSDSETVETPSAHGTHLKGYEAEAEKIASSVADKTGEEREKATWEKVSAYIKEQEGLSVKELVSQGKLNILEEYRDMYTGAGNSASYFNERILDECKSAYKKTINYDNGYVDSWAQGQMRLFMTDNGMTDADVSAMVYKSETAKDLKVAMRIGDEELIQESLMPLVAAGLTQADLDKLWDNRNRVDLKKYKDNGGRYADKLKSMGTFIWPTEGVITSHFGYRSAASTNGIGSTNHPAIDIGASQGTPVVAADGGVVIYAGNNGGYGNSVGIKHDNGMVTYYNHLYAWNVKVGDTVGQGQQIAQVGSTGRSTGPHLDFKILDKDGKPVDPEKYLN